MKPHGVTCIILALAIGLLVVPRLGPWHGCCEWCYGIHGITGVSAGLVYSFAEHSEAVFLAHVVALFSYR